MGTDANGESAALTLAVVRDALPSSRSDPRSECLDPCPSVKSVVNAWFLNPARHRGKEKPAAGATGLEMERAMRLELTTSTLARWCSTN
jgi:hypothetical protein